MPQPLAKPGPLSGVRIIEIDAIGPVPLAAMMLADMGAEVIRVARSASAGAGAWSDVGGDILHRSRDVLHLDLKNGDDRGALLDLVACADALIEGFRPGVMERLGLGPDACLQRNPRLVYGRMTGWGQNGPLALRAGHDINYIAVTGALHAMGDAGRPPPVPLNLVGDYGGGSMFLVSGLLAAIISAQRTGAGQIVDACITDGVATFLSLYHAWEPKGLWHDRPASNLLDGAAPFYRCYRCADGRDVAVGCLEPQFFAAMVDGLGLADRGYDQADRASWPTMQDDFASAFATRSRDEWAALFAATDACVSPVLSMTEAADYPHNAARGTYSRNNGLVQPGPAPRMSRTPSAIGATGETTIAAVLESWKGA